MSSIGHLEGVGTGIAAAVGMSMIAGARAAQERAAIARRRVADAYVAQALADQSAVIAKLVEALAEREARIGRLTDVVHGLEEEVEDLEGELAAWRSRRG